MAESLPDDIPQERDLMLYEFEEVLKRITGKGEEEGVSDKEAGVRLGVSERVIRRCKGGMDAFDADLLCTRGLGLHPAIVYSVERWAGVGVPGFHAELEREAAEADVKAAAKGKRKKAS